MAASIEDLLASLPGLAEPIETLQTLKTAALALPLSTLRERAPGLQLGVIFSLLNFNDREHVALCVAILERFLQALEPVHVARSYKEELKRGLYHPDDSVKLLTISQVGRIVGSPEAITEILNNLELLKQIILCIGGDKISVANEAIKSLSKIAQTTAGLDVLFGSNLLTELKNVMATSDIVRYRVYEMVVEISSVSSGSLSCCVNSGLIPQLLEELSGADVLVRVTCIEMVTALAATVHGRQYLEQQGVIDKISNMILGADSDPFAGFYLPGLVKFFGNLAIVDSPQQICEHYPAFLEKVLDMAEGRDATMMGVAVDTLGVLASNMEGKQVLHKTGTFKESVTVLRIITLDHTPVGQVDSTLQTFPGSSGLGSRFQNILKRMGDHAKNASTEQRIRCLDAISSLLYLPPDHHTEDLLGMTESWFSSFSNQPMDLFRAIASQPFPELHCGALKVFTAIANQPWAQKLMIESPGFIEYVVNRMVDPDKDSKDAKFELVKALVKSKTIAEVFGNQHYLRLRTYLREGPYYVTAIATVAVEEAD